MDRWRRDCRFPPPDSNVLDVGGFSIWDAASGEGGTDPRRGESVATDRL